MIASKVNNVIANIMLEIWNPEKLEFLYKKTRNKEIRLSIRRSQLFYKTKGIVLHDRELNK